MFSLIGYFAVLLVLQASLLIFATETTEESDMQNCHKECKNTEGRGEPCPRHIRIRVQDLSHNCPVTVVLATMLAQCSSKDSKLQTMMYSRKRTKGFNGVTQHMMSFLGELFN